MVLYGIILLRYFSYFSQKREVAVLCKLSKETICMKCQILFSDKKYENYFKMSSAEILANMLLRDNLHAMLNSVSWENISNGRLQKFLPSMLSVKQQRLKFCDLSYIPVPRLWTVSRTDCIAQQDRLAYPLIHLHSYPRKSLHHKFRLRQKTVLQKEQLLHNLQGSNFSTCPVGQLDSNCYSPLIKLYSSLFLVL